MKFSLCILFSLCISASYAQENTDSLFAVALKLYEHHQYDSSIYYFNKMLQNSSNKDSRATALNGVGVAYSAKGFPNKSIPYYVEAIALYEELKDTTTATTISNNLAIIYKDKGLYEEALEISFNALPKLEKQPPSRTLASSYNTVGAVYKEIQDYNKAYEFFRKALNVRMSISYDQGVGQSYGNIGDLFNETKQYDSALSNLYKAVEIRLKLNDTRGLGRITAIIGNTLTQSGNARKGIEKLKEALEFNRVSNDVIGEILSLQELGNSYISVKDFKHAEEYLNAASSLIRKTGTNLNLRKNLELRAALYKQTGDKIKLNDALERLIVVKDSILNEEKIESLLTLEIQYETEKKEQEIVLLQQQQKTDRAELENTRLQRVVLIIVVIFLIAIAALGYRLYFAKQKEKKASDLHNKEMHHRTKNNLQMLSSFFTIQASVHEDNKKTQELIVDMQGRVKTMALVHSKLYKSMDASELDLREYITELVTSLLYTYGFNTGKLRLELGVDELHLDIDKAIKIGLITNELITNALKYAFIDQNEPSLKVSISKEGDSIKLMVEDNGKHPLSTDVFNSGGSFGLKMIKSFVRDLRGQIELKDDNGTSFSISIP